MQNRTTISQQFAGFMERQSGWFILAVFVLTVLLAIPMITMAPTDMASDNPGGTVYDLEKTVNNTLPPRTHVAGFIVEARDGDMLTREPLLELYRNVQDLRHTDQKGQLSPPGLPAQPYLYYGFDTDRQQPIVGIYTLADAVQEILIRHPSLNTDLEQATEEQVKFAVSQVLNEPQYISMQESLSQEKHVERKTILGQEIDYWTSPALLTFFVADNTKLGGGALRIGATGDLVTERKEHLNRKVQDILRGEQRSYQLWGIAIDVGLELADEVGTAVPFIMATFVTILVVVGISLRSVRVVLLTGMGLAAMIIWLKGLSNLVGLNSSTTLDFIVPIAMISLGADFTIHAISRYREERRDGLNARRAFRVGMAGVLAALVIAMMTDATAFLSNASVDIETVIGFGIGAALATFAAFIILGLTVPLALMRLDAWRETTATGTPNPKPVSLANEPDLRHWSLATLVVVLARLRLFVLPIATVVTIVSAYYAFQVEASFDVKDIFKSDSDFAVGLTKLDEHVGQSEGEPAIIYIHGDLADPAVLMAIQEFLGHLSDNPYVAKNDEGEPTLQARNLFALLDQVMGSTYARAQVKEATGISLNDDSIYEFHYAGRVFQRPASRTHLEAIYDYIAENGVPASPTQNIYDAFDVGEILSHDPPGTDGDATTIVVGIPGTREQANVVASRDTLTKDILSLEASQVGIRAGLTGSPYIRQAGLDATTEGLQRAFIIAAAACLLISIVAMRSLRFGIVTIIPIGLVVTWLYAFMYLFGFSLNFMTATIAAVSIGVGIDYAVHMTQRFREELTKTADKDQALRQAAQGTGAALLASAATSAIGFTIMAFAPMPLFSSYGVLTAVMISLAATASLLVLPSLLLLVTPTHASDF